MELPLIAQKLISEYSKPLTRPDWRNGAIYNNSFKYSPIMNETIKLYKRRYKGYSNYESISDLILDKGEIVFDLYPYYIEYSNFYFYLCNEDNAFLNKKRILKQT